MCINKSILKHLLVSLLITISVVFFLSIVLNEYNRAFADVNIAEGTVGTCKWIVDANGTLTIYEGEIYNVNIASLITDSGVDSQNVKSVKFSGNVKVAICGHMFLGCGSLTSIDLSGLDTSSVTDMSYMFDCCESLTSIDLSGLDTSSVTDMSYMFSGCRSLTSVTLSGLDTSNVTDMRYMFLDCESLTSIDLSGLDTSSVTDMSYMFSGCTSLTSIDLSDLDASNVTNMGYMFSGCTSMTSIDLSGLDTSNVAVMSYMFYHCESLSLIDLSGLDTSNVSMMGYMFSGCTSMTSIDLSGLDTSSVIDMSYMFFECESLSSIDLSGLDTSNVTNMSSMFYLCTSMTSIDLSGLDTSSVTMMSKMFVACNSLTQLNLSSFNASNAWHMGWMFDECNNLRILKIGKGFNTAISNYGESVIFPVKMFNYETAEEYEARCIIPKEDYAIYVSDLSIDPYTGFEIDTSNVHDSFTTVSDYEPRTYSGDEGFYYKDSYFYEDATKYNHSLATMSLCMAFTTYGYMDDYDNPDYSNYDRNVKALMTRCGFADKGLYEQYNFNEKPQADYIGCAIGSKTITVNDKDTTLIAVAVRGGGYEREWASNFDIGKNGDHDGFDLNADRVKDYVVNYITTKKIKGDVKIWITGYSRAGAVSTQAAAKLDDMSGFAYENPDEESGYSYVFFDNTSIYAYGFASPAGANTNSDPHSDKYNNIFSIIEYNDPVPLVAPKKWGFDRYGTTKIFPYIESSNSKKYKQYIDRVWFRVNNENGYKIDNFLNYKIKTVPNPAALAFPNVTVVEDTSNKDTQGTVLRKSIKNLADHIGNRDRFVDNYQATVQAIWRGDPNKSFSEIIAELAIKILPGFFVKHPNLTTTLATNLPILADTHANQDYYISWMQLMDENYRNSLPLLWGEKDYRVFSAKCPVDLYVYDKNNNLVASIIDEQPSDNDDQEIVVSIDENGQKLAYLPIGSDYRVEVKARENCEVTCGIEEYEAEFGNPTRLTNYNAVSLMKNEQLEATIPAFSEEEIEQGAENGSSADYTLNKDGQEVDKYSDLHGSEFISEHVYDISLMYNEKEGTVYGGGSFTEGSLASITAVSNKGYEFEGFYVNGNKYSDDNTDVKNNIKIKVTKDLTMEAKFVKTSADEGEGKRWHYSYLKYNTLTYTGKPRDPKPIVRDSDTGKALIKNVDYKVSYYSSHTAIGSHKVKITAIGTYAGFYPSTYTFKIIPGKAAIKSVARKKKAFTVKIKKQGGGVKYQYQYKTGKGKWKSKKIKKCALTVKKLKAKKAYKVRVRAFKKVGSKVYYGSWSKVRTVKTK